MNTTQPRTHPKSGIFAPSARAARKQQQAAARAAHDAIVQPMLSVLIAELRPHGSLPRACAAAGINSATLWNWRQRDATLDHDVRRAMQFAKSDAVDFAKWAVL